MHEKLHSDLVFRAAAADDLPAILTLLAQPDMDDGRVLGLAEARRLYERLAQNPDLRLSVAERDGRIVGTFTLLILRTLGHAGTPSGVIEDIVVAGAARQQGVGAAMIAEALRLCREQGCYKLALSSNLRRDGAHAFYDRLGFERHGYSFVIDPAATGN
ncbi:MAG: GNAT family N-acetyltransferase [Chromatiaceae bacterium]|nr:GNAT family N-acetyltransferase [Gammaproteobacteria bacterium]MCP5314626.1 GNAT family N-acetyltransferase [Chromatiaceae bacterium]